MVRLLPWLLLAWQIHGDTGRTHRPASAAVSGGRVLHRSPGRIRLRLPPAAAVEVRKKLLLLPEVAEVRYNPRSQVLLVCHDPARLDGDVILALCQPAFPAVARPSEMIPVAGFPSSPPKPSRSPRLAPRAGELFGRALFDTFARQTIERSVFTMVTTVLKGH
ncbi:MAG: hypothetical protein HQL76_16420 [Magnetococcales bacterium]|nr:hypothetical protein [Magnetococcales bacterium]